MGSLSGKSLLIGGLAFALVWLACLILSQGFLRHEAAHEDVTALITFSGIAAVFSLFGLAYGRWMGTPAGGKAMANMFPIRMFANRQTRESLVAEQRLMAFLISFLSGAAAVAIALGLLVRLVWVLLVSGKG